MSHGAFLHLRNRAVQVTIRTSSGDRRFQMSGRGVIRFGEWDEVAPDATIALDLGVAQHLSSPDTTLDDVRVAVDAGMVTVSGDTALLERISLGAMMTEAWRAEDSSRIARSVQG